MGSAPVPTPLNWGNHGGIAPTGLHNSFRGTIFDIRFAVISASVPEEKKAKIISLRNILKNI